MGKCTTCGKPDFDNSGLCFKHGGRKQVKPQTSHQKMQAEKNARTKVQVEKAKQERAPIQLKMAEKAIVQRQKDEEKKQKIEQIARQWMVQVNNVVNQVRGLRQANPKVAGINAGKNTVGNTQGGTDSPLSFALGALGHGITKADVFAQMSGFDGSDSGVLKIRVMDTKGNILVHIR